MLEKFEFGASLPSWSSDRRQIITTAFLDRQADAVSTNSWFVPYQTGVLLKPNNSILVCSHLNHPPSPENIELQTFTNSKKHGLETSGIYDCCGLVINALTFQCLIHAFGPQSLDVIVKRIDEILQLTEQEITAMILSYNLHFPRFVVQYEWLTRKYRRQFRPKMFQRRLVNEHCVIKV